MATCLLCLTFRPCTLCLALRLALRLDSGQVPSSGNQTDKVSPGVAFILVWRVVTPLLVTVFVVVALTMITVIVPVDFYSSVEIASVVESVMSGVGSDLYP